jgi:hypothetical protein
MGAGDVYMPVPVHRAAATTASPPAASWPHLFLVPTRAQRQATSGSRRTARAQPGGVRHTYSTLPCAQALFEACPRQPAGQIVKLAPLLRAAMDRGE